MFFLAGCGAGATNTSITTEITVINVDGPNVEAQLSSESTPAAVDVACGQTRSIRIVGRAGDGWVFRVTADMGRRTLSERKGANGASLVALIRGDTVLVGSETPPSYGPASGGCSSASAVAK